MRNLIRLAQPVLRLLGRDDRGAIGVLVALLITTGVLLGLGALVIDVGQLYQSRAELQNGADAGALAVAKSCASGNCDTTLAQPITTQNTTVLTRNHLGTDQVAVFTCSQSSCPQSTIPGCPKAPSGVAGYVDVLTSAIKVPPVFARTLQGKSTYPGTDVKACAQAAWGGPTTANTVGFTISACSWYYYTNDGTSYAQPPPYPPNTPPTQDDIFFMHGKQGSLTTGCPPYQPSGQDAPGNFGWVGSGNPCTVSINNGTYNGNTGGSASKSCQTLLQDAYANKTVLYVPVYSSISTSNGGGINTTYTLLGFAAFVVTGYDIGGSFRAPDYLEPAHSNCGNTKTTPQDYCINGYLTHALIPPPVGGLGGNNLGALAVSLTG